MRVSAIKDEIAASLRRPDRCVLIHLAIADGKLITISDIAESFDISKQHLMKVVNDLSQKGYVKRTTRGISARR